MAFDPKKRQRKLERQSAKRKARQRQLVTARNKGLGQRLAAAANGPVLHCEAAETLWTQGLGQVWLSRQMADGAVAYSVFLVDRYCLGVKDAFGNVVSRFTYESEVAPKLQRDVNVRSLTPAAARKLVEGAVDYARRLGFAPHPDYHNARLIFGDIDTAECAEEFEFGANGKPHFMPGPYDNPGRCRTILHTLLAACGPDGFHYTLPLDLARQVLPEPLQKRKARVIAEDKDGTVREFPSAFFDE